MYYAIVKETKQGRMYLSDVQGYYYEWVPQKHSAVFFATKEVAESLATKYDGKVMEVLISIVGIAT